MKKSFNASPAAQTTSEVAYVGEFSIGNFVADIANPAVVPVVKGRKVPAGYMRPFEDYRPSDMGNAERLFDLYGNDFRFAPHMGWLQYKNGLWAHTEGFGNEREAVKATIRQMGDMLKAETAEVAVKAEALRKANLESKPDAIIDMLAEDLKAARAALKKKYEHYEASCGEAKYGACLRTAASDPGFVVRPDELDADDYKLNTKSGVLNLLDGTEMPHRPDYLMTRTSATSIAPEGTQCPEWLGFLRAVFDDGNAEETAEMIDYMQLVIAYMLSGSTRFEAMFILGGSAGGNGKSTCMSIVNALLGTYGLSVDCKTFQFKNAEDTSIPNDLAKTAGTRATTMDELPKGYRFNSPLTKAYISGTTPLTARFLHKEFFEWHSKAKLLIATNYLPSIRDDEAMWRRVHLIKCNNSFKAKPDEKLGAKLAAELPAIMRWAQQGITKLTANGLVRPARVQRDTDAYKASQDDFGAFVAEQMETGSTYFVRTSQAFSMYKTWAEENNHHAMSKGTFRRTMAERGFDVKTKSGNEVFVGLQVIQVADLSFA